MQFYMQHCIIKYDILARPVVMEQYRLYQTTGICICFPMVHYTFL